MRTVDIDFTTLKPQRQPTLDGTFNPMLTSEELVSRNVRLRETKNTKVSVVFVVRNEHEWIQKSVESLHNCKTNYEYECIIYDDGSTDGYCSDFEVDVLLSSKNDSIGPSRARNWGAIVARGEFLIFCDGHLNFNDYWIDKLVEKIEEDVCDVVNPIISDIAIPTTEGYGWEFDTKSYEYKWGNRCTSFEFRGGMAGGCFAIRKDVFMRVGMFDKAFTKWGMEDSELALRLSLSGYRIGIEPSVNVGHFFKESNEYGVDWFSYNYNFLRMAYVNMDNNGFNYVYNLINGSESDKNSLKSAVMESSKFRKMQVARLQVISFKAYLEKFGRKMT